jgi:cyclic pyranopterin phosphate synthase
VGIARPLTDTYGRVHRDLRISVTDRCNYRCTYCMPADGLEWLPRAELLTFEEIERIARVCVERYGIDSIRLTGGEPTVRHALPDLVGRLAGLGVDIALTTNGSRLASLARPLADAGLRRINVSCDSLHDGRFAALTRRDDLPAVLAGIDAALEAGLDPVKLNVVLRRGVNDDEAVPFAEFGRDKGVTVRFIEFMPLDADGGWSSGEVVPGREIVAAIDAVHPLEPVRRDHEPAARWRYRDGRGEIGVIDSVTEPFCASCDRIRLTAEGKLRACLFATDEVDLRPVLRGGGSDDDLARILEDTVLAKGPGHQIGQVAFVRPRRSMSQIGG